ncbi:TetR/AcrR family transcriptional regulator [Pendulispora rubella]|uniref:TetR/AcrR family transcriptional regulator n=1 Tax=Pendulispora rubella TaxID=2741070 RepID=A0ABZ2L1I7_9BACT
MSADSQASGTRQDRRKARTRAQILDAAEERFAAVGAELATIEQIADAADVAVATVYLHFAKKEDLHLAVVERALEENERHMLAVYDSDAPPVDKLVDAVGAYLRFYLESPRLFQVVAMPPGGTSTDTAALVLSERIDRMTRALAKVIKRGIDEGTLRGVAPLDTARFLWGALNGVFALAQRPDRLRLSDRELRSALQQGAEILALGVVTDSQRDADGRLAPKLRNRLRKAIGATK